MNIRPDARAAPWIALGLLVAVILALGLAIGLPLHAALMAGGERLDEMSQQLVRYRNIVAARTELEQRHADLQRLRSVQGAYLSAGSSALAAAELQGLAKRRIATAGGRLTSVQVNPVSEEGAVARIGINVKMRTDLNNLVKLFYAIETGRPVLFIDHVRLRSLSAGAFRNRPGVEELDVGFEVYGYMRLDKP